MWFDMQGVAVVTSEKWATATFGERPSTHDRIIITIVRLQFLGTNTNRPYIILNDLRWCPTVHGLPTVSAHIQLTFHLVLLLIVRLFSLHARG